MTFVAIHDLTFRYTRGEPAVIDRFSFSMQKGEIVGVLGPSGSGKSTLLRMIAGLEVPDSGQVVIDGQVMVSDSTCVEADKRGVGMVFQDYALFPHLTVAGNVAFGLHRFKRGARQQRLRHMLELVQLTDYAGRYPHELSGGQRQRVALARALAPQPSMLLMDEPFSSLDADLKAAIRSELRDILQRAEMTCLLVSHDEQDVGAICDRAIRIGAEAAREKVLVCATI